MLKKNSNNLMLNSLICCSRFQLSICFYLLIIFVAFSVVSIFFDTSGHHNSSNVESYQDKFSMDMNQIKSMHLSSETDSSRHRNVNCTFWDCFNVYRCGQSGSENLKIFVYPIQSYSSNLNGKSISVSMLSQEYYEILRTIIQSSFYTHNPNEACLFLPSIDMLNEDLIENNVMNLALATLSHWDSGENHIIINMLPGTFPMFNTVTGVHTDKAIILGGGFDSFSYRKGFDISLPVWSQKLNNFKTSKYIQRLHRRYILIIAQLNTLPLFTYTINKLEYDYSNEILVLRKCHKQMNGLEKSLNFRCRAVDHKQQRQYVYPKVLSKGAFCLLTRSFRLGQPDLLEMLAYNCIPVVAIDNYVLPFSEIIDWSLAVVQVRETDIYSLIPKLKRLSTEKVIELRQQGHWLYNRYFLDLRTITLTALQILQSRIFPHRAQSLLHYNIASVKYKNLPSPIFLPLGSAKAKGFTAVVLAYDRLESLFDLIQKLSLVSSLHSILVIWNNQNKPPPHISTFPTLSKHLKVIQTTANKLSNRFFPYSEIDTEAILTIDDDIVMLTADELDFGFEVWREFPDRIVGFPSRVHVWDNSTSQWHYESEWKNEISMVLTGAAFHHKVWSHMYTYSMPGDIRKWVDDHMNCEDIAMNFLIANKTNKPPIKVTPRKKFKCPECVNNEILSADLNHMRQRSACIERFVHVYGHMPLRSVEFRADPVLYKDDFPEKLKRFNDVGTL